MDDDLSTATVDEVGTQDARQAECGIEEVRHVKDWATAAGEYAEGSGS